MRKIVAMVVLLTVFSCSSVWAADIDVSTLDYEALSELKQKVDQEFNSRPESEPVELKEGTYTVGADIKPGNYYFAYVKPTENYSGARLHVYENKEKYDSKSAASYGEYLLDEYFNLGANPKSISLEEGNFLYLQNGSLMYRSVSFEASDYYTYEVPDGTPVPKGIYHVPDDIPAGRYTIYAADISGGNIDVYYSEEAKEQYDLAQLDIYTVAPEVSEIIELKDGFLVEVDHDIIMKKAGQLAF